MAKEPPSHSKRAQFYQASYQYFKILFRLIKIFLAFILCPIPADVREHYQGFFTVG